MPESTTVETPGPDAAGPEASGPEAPITPGTDHAAPDAVRGALARVLDSDELRSSPQLSNILRFVVEATLDGRRDAIKGYTIAVEALGRDPSFDPQADPIVRVEATRLRRALERYYAGAGAGDALEIAIPRGSYVPHFLPRPAPGMAVAAPAGGAPEAEPEPPAAAEAGEQPAAPVRPVPAARRRGWVRLALGLLLLAVAMMVSGLAVESVDPLGLRALLAGASWHPIERTNRLGIPMVEVRDFDSAGGPPLPPSEIAGSAGAVTSGDFTAQAIEVRVRDALARFDLLDVLASPDARPALSCSSEGASPNSAFALGGLVENHDDGTLSVLLRLSDLCDGTIVWSREFDSLRRGSDATASEIALVRDIMAAIAEPYGIIQARARARVTAAGGPQTAGPYGCVLTAYSYWRSYKPAEHAAARDCLEQAVEADSTFALGYALLAELESRRDPRRRQSARRHARAQPRPGGGGAGGGTGADQRLRPPGADGRALLPWRARRHPRRRQHRAGTQPLRRRHHRRFRRPAGGAGGDRARRGDAGAGGGGGAGHAALGGLSPRHRRLCEGRRAGRRRRRRPVDGRGLRAGAAGAGAGQPSRRRGRRGAGRPARADGHRPRLGQRAGRDDPPVLSRPFPGLAGAGRPCRPRAAGAQFRRRGELSRTARRHRGHGHPGTASARRHCRHAPHPLNPRRHS
ncbi:hypothetical protein ACFSKM_22075 [Ancylobacter dichloromethanicus]